MAAWEIELEKALVAAIEADAPLVALLGSGRVFARRPFRRAAYPQLTFLCRDESFPGLSGGGRVDAHLQLDIWGRAGSSAAVRDALEALLDEGRRLRAGHAASPVTLQSWRCGEFRYLRSEELPTGELTACGDSSELFQRVTEWQIKLYRVET
jgi:hypothetical protein